MLAEILYMTWCACRVYLIKAWRTFTLILQLAWPIFAHWSSIVIWTAKCKCSISSVPMSLNPHPLEIEKTTGIKLFSYPPSLLHAWVSVISGPCCYLAFHALIPKSHPLTHKVLMIILIWICHFRVSKMLSLKICEFQILMFLIHTGFDFELLFSQLVWFWRAKVSDVVIALALSVKHKTPFDLVLSSIYSLLMFFPRWYSSLPMMMLIPPWCFSADDVDDR